MKINPPSVSDRAPVSQRLLDSRWIAVGNGVATLPEAVWARPRTVLAGACGITRGTLMAWMRADSLLDKLVRAWEGAHQQSAQAAAAERLAAVAAAIGAHTSASRRIRDLRVVLEGQAVPEARVRSWARREAALAALIAAWRQGGAT